jgi:membrane fusion protein (multidrug efflux system)
MAQESSKDRTFSPQADIAPVANNGTERNSKKPNSFLRRLKIILPLLLVVAAIGYFAWRWYIGNRDFVSTDDAYVDANRVAISSKILGRIDTLTVDEGDSVRAGEMLVRLDPSDLLAQQAQTHSALALARENVRLADVNRDKARQDYERAQAQFKANVIPAEQLDHAQKEYEAAQARYAISEAQVASSQTQIGVVDTSLLNMTISSPINGVVSKRWALPGDVVQPAQPIFTIYDLGDIWVTANLEETKLRSIRLGDSVSVDVDAYPDRHFRGRVFQFGSNTASQFSLLPPNNASGNFTKVTQRVPVKIRLENVPANVTLLPGMSTEVKVRVRYP